MILEHLHTVTPESGPRPAGPPDKCFYCGEKIGSQHKGDCAIRQRTVVVRWTLEYVVDVPESWTPEQIEFHRNMGTWCSNNALDELARYEPEEVGNGVAVGRCLCELSKWEYVREAVEEESLDFMDADLSRKEGE